MYSKKEASNTKPSNGQKKCAKSILPNSSSESVEFTRITSMIPTTLTKSYFLDETNSISCKVSAQMVEGEAELVQVTDAASFADVLKGLQSNQALCFGVAHTAKTRMLSRKEYEKQGMPSDAITRTQKNMTWPQGAGVLMLDYDPQEGETPLSRAQLLAILTEVMPDLKSTAYVWWCSASSLIYNDHEQLHGLRGQRVYILVKNAADISRAGDILFNRLWLAGHGYHIISRSGNALERSVVDRSVWQTNRLDFAAGAYCKPPLQQRRADPIAHEGSFLDTCSALPDLTIDESAEIMSIKNKKFLDIKSDIQRIRDEYIESETLKTFVKSCSYRSPEAQEQAKSTIRIAAEKHVLTGDYIVILDDETEITVADILNDPEKYNGRLTLDPLEPEYRNHKVVGKLYLECGHKSLYSQAHGGQAFRLMRQQHEIQHIAGKTSDTTRKTLEHMKNLEDVFDLGPFLVLIKDGSLHKQTTHSLSYFVGQIIQYVSYGQSDKKRLLDPPDKVINQILELKNSRGFNELKAVITAPVMRFDTYMRTRQGYDPITGLYLHMPGESFSVPNYVSEDQALSALEFLMAPFEGFMTATALDKGVLLAAVLTAVQRPILTTAPAFGLDAPVQGTGKTFLAQCLGTLATGKKPAVYPHTAGRDDEEVRKRITSVLASGESVMIWDNILGVFDSASMASLLTSETFNDRILGRSESISLPNKMLVLFTGNNLTLAGDMPRRVLKCRLDALVDNPASRKFTYSPLRYIEENRLELVQAAITLIKGYLQSDTCRHGGAVPGESTASFEEWDFMIRQTVAWVADTLYVHGYADPGQAFKDAIAIDPEVEALGEVLEAIEIAMGTAWFESRELYNLITAKNSYDFVNNYSNINNPQYAELNDMLQDMSFGKALSVKGLGRILSFREGRIVDGRKISKRQANRKTQFRIEKLQPTG